PADISRFRLSLFRSRHEMFWSGSIHPFPLSTRPGKIPQRMLQIHRLQKRVPTSASTPPLSTLGCFGLRNFDCLQQSRGLVNRFVEFKARHRIGNDTGTGLDLYFTIFKHESSDRDARIHVARVIEVTYRARVNSTPRRFESLN